MRNKVPAALVAAMFVQSPVCVVHGQCEAQWTEGRGFPGTNGPVSASTAWDPDGAGGQSPMAVIGGSFNIAGDTFANNIAAWNGSEWMALGAGIPGANTTVRTLAVFDDGSGGGPALYAGGFFNVAGGAPANYIARWDGETWSAVGGGMDGRVEALVVHDDGSGPALYAGGAFINAGGQPAHFIARWDGKDWSPVGTGMDNWVLALTVFDDGDGLALHAGGQFIIAGGTLAPFAAKWDGQSWSDLDTGEVDGVIHALTTYDDGGGTDLYAAGEFTFIGTLAVANFIARWDGSTWSSLGAAANGTIYSLAVFDDDGRGGPALHAGGAFTSAGIVDANHIASWDGAEWSALGDGVNNTVTSLAAVEHGSSASLYVGGLFHAADDLAARHVAMWDGAAWSNLGSGAGMNAAILAMTDFNDGSGPALHAAGGFTTAGSAIAGNVARWNATPPDPSWSSLDGGTNFLIQALAVFDDGLEGAGEGGALYAGGWFTAAGGAPASYIARWDGADWSPVGDGVSYIVRALAVFDDGSGAGPALYVGGAFQAAGGEPASFIARWDGAAWSTLSTGVNNAVYALTVFDDGTGPALYAGGEFTTAGDEQANYIARWDGRSWSPLGSGMNSAVYALTTFDDGTGPALYAGGFFSTADEKSANCIARWDGESWSALGTGMSGGQFPAVLALAVFDDGVSGSALYAGGQFTVAGGIPANCIARWSSGESAWLPLSTGLQGTSAPAVHALTVFDDGGGPALHVGGAFHVAGGIVSAYWARWGCVSSLLPADLDGDGIVGPADLAELLAQWGACAKNCSADIAPSNGDGVVGPADLAALLAGWSPAGG